MKQDRQGARTPAALERKYGGKKSVANEVNNQLRRIDQNDIFNRLTDYGRSQGLFQGDDGNIYINAAFIVGISELFSKDITMAGKFTNTADVFLSPGDEEVQTIRKHINGEEYIPDDRLHLYDFDSNGTIDGMDCILAERAAIGAYSLEAWAGAVKTTVSITIDMSNAAKLIHIHGMNMWGREIDTFISANAVNSTFATRNYVDALMKTDGEHLYRFVNGETEWFNPPMESGVEYRTTERFAGQPVYKCLIYVDSTCFPPSVGELATYDYPGKGSRVISIEGSINSGYDYVPFGCANVSIKANDNGITVANNDASLLADASAYITVKYTKQTN